MRSLTDVLIWFIVSVVLTISIGWIGVISPMVSSTINTLIWLFYSLIVIDGVLFILLVVLIINSIKKEGFE